MRARMRAQGLVEGHKHGPGGILDIDFIAQLGVLEQADRVEALRAAADTTAQLEALSGTGWLSSGEAQALIEARSALTRARHLDALTRPGASAGLKDEAKLEPLRNAVLEVAERLGITPPA